MTSQQIIGLGVRCFSIFLIMRFITYMLAFPVVYQNGGLENLPPIFYIVNLLELVIAVILWFFPVTIGKKIIPGAIAENTQRMSAYNFAIVGCSLVGLWIFAHSILSLLQFILDIALRLNGDSIINSLNVADKLSLFFHLIKIVFSCFLIFRPHVFASIVIPKYSKDINNSQEQE